MEKKKVVSFTKSDIVSAAAEKSGYRKTDCEKIVEAVLDGIKDALREGFRVDIRGFGTFKPKDVAARTARNPKTGESVEVAAHRKVSFKAGKDLV